MPCGQSRETAKRSELAGWAAYGYGASHSRSFWGLRLYLLCAPNGMPICFCLAGANEPERDRRSDARPSATQRAAHRRGDHRQRQGLRQQRVRADCRLTWRAAHPPRPQGERKRFGKLGGIRRWIESIINTSKAQLSLEDHGGHIPEGVWARVCERVLALAAGIWPNWLLWEARQIDTPGRHFTAYDH